MTYRNVTIFLNRRCTVGCPNCNVRSRPGNKRDLTGNQVIRLLEKQREHALADHLIWTGGEPFLSFPVLQAGIAAASRLGLPSEILTSGSWFQKDPDLLVELRRSGEFSLRISVDGEHQDRIPLNTVLDLVRFSRQQKVPVNFTLRHIPGHPFRIRDARNRIQSILPGREMDSRRFHVIPHFQVIQRTRPKRDSKAVIVTGPCGYVFRDLVVGNDGNIYPCCGVFQHPNPPDLSIGTLETVRPTTLESARQRRRDLQLLARQGPAAVLGRRGLGAGDLNRPGIRTRCELCFALWDLPADPFLAQ